MAKYQNNENTYFFVITMTWYILPTRLQCNIFVYVRQTSLNQICDLIFTIKNNAGVHNNTDTPYLIC